MSGGRRAGHGGSLHSGGKGRLPVKGKIDVRLAHWLPGKPAEEHAPTGPFDKLSWCRCFDLKVRTITS